jgi:hypothetical protein
MTTWEIRTLNAAPSMNETVKTITGTYIEACNAARAIFAETGRRTNVVTGMYWWFRANKAGEINRNTNAATR